MDLNSIINTNGRILCYSVARLARLDSSASLLEGLRIHVSRYLHLNHYDVHSSA
jgi:hypothetical protein